ncbi:MAG: hypothetical protein Q8M02_08610 [Candidatus Didemnitutus sp.]|nr:hypothetical protein [Candidatus Didemnitutus sp.]
MTDPEFGAANTAIPETIEATASDAFVATERRGDGCALISGVRWKHFEIGEQEIVRDADVFRATDTRAMEEVLIAAERETGGARERSRLWAALGELRGVRLLKLRETEREEGWRYEIFVAPPGTPLREWIACHQAGLKEIELLVRQLTEIIEAMHQAGVVHLGIRPDSIYVNETGRTTEVWLGGLSHAAVLAKDEDIAISPSPYYAPPEAAGQSKLRSSPELFAWDWWSVGRVVQEFVHGQHAYGLLFERDVKGNPPGLLARAEATLLDRDPSGVRAGAVELLPEETPPRLRLLLRGLLTGCLQGRWGSDQVQCWLRNETVPDRYDIPLTARLFSWRRRSFTVSEVAEFFSQPDNALEGQAQLFPLGDRLAGTFLGFLQEAPEWAEAAAHTAELIALVESAPWQNLPLNARRSVVTGLIWRSLATDSARPSLRVQRWKVDLAGLQELMADAPPVEAVALCRALVTPAFRRVLTGRDAVAEQAVGVLSEVAFGALEQALKQKWLQATDAVAQSRLLRLGLATEQDLVARINRLRVNYGPSKIPLVVALMEVENPDAQQLVLLAYMTERPKDFGFVSKHDWANERAAQMEARAATVCRLLVWLRLRHIVMVNPAVYGSWPIWTAIWVVPITFCAAAEHWIIAGIVAALAVLLRQLGIMRLNWRLRCMAGEFAPWDWQTRPSRASAEISMLQAECIPPLNQPYAVELKALHHEASGLKLSPPLNLPCEPSAFALLWGSGIAGSIVVLTVIISSIFWALQVDAGPQILSVNERVANFPISEKDSGEAATEIFEVFNDGFGRRPRGPLRPWDISTNEPTPLPVRGMRAAKPSQQAFARVGAELLLEPYPRQGLHARLAVPLAVEGRWAIMLYDTSNFGLADGRLFFVEKLPPERAWYWVGNRRVLYLGAPEVSGWQNSLAEP